MVRPALRSRSFRRVKTRLPGGSYTTHFEKRMPSQAVCTKCKRPLHGLARLRPLRMQGLPKSRRSVNRPYGGNLCSPCMRAEIRNKTIK